MKLKVRLGSGRRVTSFVRPGKEEQQQTRTRAFPLFYVVITLVLVFSVKNVRTSFQSMSSLDVGSALQFAPKSRSVASGPVSGDFPYSVQAWPDRGDISPARELPSTNRTLFLAEDVGAIEAYIRSLPTNVSANLTTINPFLPSYKLPENLSTHLNLEIPVEYSIEAPMTSKIPWSNVTSAAFYEGRLTSGFRNQVMVFTSLILECIHKGHHQFLLRSVSQKDLFGTNKFMPFEKLWDVPHWNSHYPTLPRLVDYDPILHSQFNFDNTRWFRTAETWFGTPGLYVTHGPTRPYGFGYQHRLFNVYMRYSKGKHQLYSPDGHRHPAEILMLQGALRPHPELQAILDRLKDQMLGRKGPSSTSSQTTSLQEAPDPFMALHARVEPEMQKHPVCRGKKVLNLTDIFDFLERQWPEPPVQALFIQINRKTLEREGQDPASNGAPKKKGNINWIAVNNLKALNNARDHGLWGGRTKVFEFGVNALANTTYADRPSVAGAMLDFYLAVSASIFVGTEVSSFSNNLVATRFFKGYHENFKYLPDGLEAWTPPGTIDPPGFDC